MSSRIYETTEYKQLRQTMDDIKTLKIQGATNVAIFGVEAFAKHAESVPLKDEELLLDLMSAK